MSDNILARGRKSEVLCGIGPKQARLRGSHCLGKPCCKPAGATRDLLSHRGLPQILSLPVPVGGEPLLDGGPAVRAEATIDVRQTVAFLTAAVGRDRQHVR